MRKYREGKVPFCLKYNYETFRKYKSINICEVAMYEIYFYGSLEIIHNISLYYYRLDADRYKQKS